MRAAVLERYGDPDDLVVRDLPAPEAGPDDVLVRVRACAVCGHDVLARRGELGTPLPRVLGHEIAGEVVQGDAAGRLAPGDRVVLSQRIPCGACSDCAAGSTQRCAAGLGFYGETLDGGYAELVLARPGNAVPIPDGLGFEAAATLPCGLCTGLHAIGRIDLAPGETVLITGASGGVGSHAVELAAARGARPIAVVREPAHVAAVEALGAARVVVADDGVFHDRLRAAGEAPAAAIECVGTPYLESTLRSLAPGGRVAVVGNVRVEPLPLWLGRVILRELDIRGSAHGTVGELREAVALAAAGAVAPRIAATLPLERVAEAHARLERGGVGGRIVLVP